MKNATLVVIVFSVAVILQACATSRCKPSLVNIAEENYIALEYENTVLEIRAIIIVCQNDLDRIANIRNTCKAVIKEAFDRIGPYPMFGRSQTQDFRRNICKEINNRIGDNAVHDIYFYQMKTHERFP
jgi:hypothetical protein